MATITTGVLTAGVLAAMAGVAAQRALGLWPVLAPLK